MCFFPKELVATAICEAASALEPVMQGGISLACIRSKDKKMRPTEAPCSQFVILTKLFCSFPWPVTILISSLGIVV